MQTLRVNKEISRIKIAEKLNLDRSTITNIISGLIDEGIVETRAEGSSAQQGGRKPVMLGISRNYGCILGIEIQVSHYRAVITDLNGDVLYSDRSPLRMEKGPFISAVRKIIERVSGEIRNTGLPLLGAGIGLPGQINPETGRIIISKPHNLTNFDFISEIGKKLGVPVLIDNDANCCAWGSLERMKELDLKNFIYIILKLHGSDPGNMPDNAIGISIVVDGKVYYGSGYAAGELILNPDTMKPLVPDINDKKMFKQYLSDIFRQFSIIISVLNPSHVFLGGELVNNRKIVNEVISEFESSLFQKNGKTECEYLFPENGSLEVAFGAASMFLEKLFSTPDLNGQDRTAVLEWEEIFIGRRKNSESIKRAGRPVRRTDICN